mmetsp:Transcript_38933/g.117615  ORF Transcript_38933/g.117615 Transcript_38933/m.117615 type:complete len:256 (+) Transcript_38933:478-1245(+)
MRCANLSAIFDSVVLALSTNFGTNRLGLGTVAQTSPARGCACSNIARYCAILGDIRRSFAIHRKFPLEQGYRPRGAGPCSASRGPVVIGVFIPVASSMHARRARAGSSSEPPRGEEGRRRSGGEDGLLAGHELEGGRRGCDLELLLVHVRLDVGEERRGEVALARVGQHGEDDRPLGRRLGRLQRRPHRAAARDAREEPLLGGETLGGGDRPRAGHRHQLVQQHVHGSVVQHFGDEIWRPPLDRVRAEGGVRSAR